jgi:hypothetical protein
MFYDVRMNRKLKHRKDNTGTQCNVRVLSDKTVSSKLTSELPNKQKLFKSRIVKTLALWSFETSGADHQTSMKTCRPALLPQFGVLKPNLLPFDHDSTTYFYFGATMTSLQQAISQ